MILSEVEGAELVRKLFSSDDELQAFILAATEDLEVMAASAADDSPRPELVSFADILRSRSVRPPNTDDDFQEGGELSPSALRAHEERVRQFLAEADVRDHEKCAELERRYPSRSERSLNRPRRVTIDGVQREVHDLSLEEELLDDFDDAYPSSRTRSHSPSGEVTRLIHREWLGQQFSDF